ncbi:MAG: hypothetical protein LBK95_07425, partial [Bifidobacteriaceae bacterium]|nr:hypothetical protein [Bifidobacteriaceae bacterium]
MGRRDDEYARVAAGVANTYDNPYNLGTRGWWAVQDILFDRFMAGRPGHLEELRGLVATTGGPALDGTRGSLAGMDEWLRAILA